jgi:hypothetical protein
MMIVMKRTQGKGHAPKDKWLMGAWDLDGCTGSMEGCDELVECGFTKGCDTHKRRIILEKCHLELL